MKRSKKMLLALNGDGIFAEALDAEAPDEWVIS
jgi:hypothetical protein